jgi:cell division protein FtsQ
MTTLNVDGDRLRSLVANDPAVHAIEVQPAFPHGLTIDVIENRPVALLVVNGHNVPVAADGTLLPGVDTGVTLPSIKTVAMPSGRRLDRGGALDRVEVASAAPRALLAKVSSISIQPGRGFVAQLNNGPAIWLGGFARLEDKWAAATAVLAQRSSLGASDIDVRMPERPVAGGLAITSTGQAAPQAPAPGAIPGAPGVLHADPSQGVTPGQAPTATTPMQTSTTPAPSPSQNPQP